jgi:DNA invertase Pin-like site-specific DNA recombinase
MKVGLYLRISRLKTSDDPEGKATATGDPEGTTTATERQKADCERYAANKGWEVVDVFTDEDISAFQPKAKRPEFERMVLAVRERQVDAILCWKLDRIARRQRDFVRLDEVCEAAGARVLTVVEGLDTKEPSGRFVAELLTSMARMESENTGIRVARKHLERAQAGLPCVGGRRLFGYDAKRTTIIEPEAALIRQAASSILAGESLRAVCRAWQARGVTTSGGRPFAPTPLRKLLSSAALSGRREHRGQVYPGLWPRILDVDIHDRLRAVLNAPSRMIGSRARRYLLTGGLAVCGRCGGGLVVHGGKYVCQREPNTTSCGKLARNAEAVEDFVRESILVALDGVDLREYMERPGQAPDALLTAIRDDEVALAELTEDYYVRRLLDRASFFAARDTLTARIEANRGGLARINGHSLLADVVGAGEAVRRQWAGRTLDWRRALVAAVVDKVEVLPYPPGQTKKVFDPSLIRIMWKF